MSPHHSMRHARWNQHQSVSRIQAPCGAELGRGRRLRGWRQRMLRSPRSGGAPRRSISATGWGRATTLLCSIPGCKASAPNWISGAHRPGTRNKRFEDAIRTWSGGNNVPSYIAYVKARVPGITENTIMDDAFWNGPMGLAFLKAQAGHEAGKPIPAPDADWIEAQRLVFNPVKLAPSRNLPARSSRVVLPPAPLIRPALTRFGSSPSGSRSPWPPSSSGSSRND
jgi:hypothetical protein